MEKRYFNVDLLAEYLSVSPNTIRKWIRQDRIPFIRIHGSIRFDKQRIDVWMDKSSKKNLVH